MLRPTLRLLVWSLSLAACGGAATPAARAPAASSCGDAEAVSLESDPRAAVFARLRGQHRATPTFVCPSGTSCTLPRDRSFALTVEPLRATACEVDACRVPSLGSLPLALTDSQRCPEVLWSLASVRLVSDAGTLDDHAPEVNVLASEAGEGFLRFIVESPASRARVLGPGDTRSLLLDVQIEVGRDSLRGQLSALAAPLPSGPASELRFTALWSATWETPLR